MATFSEKVKLTERTVAAAQPAPGERAKFYLDETLIGFGLAVSAKGSKSYFVMRRVNGRQVRYVFRRVGEGTCQQARVEASGLLAQMAAGVDLGKQRAAAREAAQQKEANSITLRKALDLYLSSAKSKGRSPRTLANVEAVLQRYLADWFDRELPSITREEARQRHQKIARDIARGKYTRGSKFHTGATRTEESGRSTANDAMRSFRTVWNRARRQHPELPECPTINVDKFTTEKPRTAMAEDQLSKWHAAVTAETNTVRRDVLLFALFTGLRRGDACSVRWADVDLKQKVLHIPQPKGGRAFDLPLIDFLVELLEGRQAENEELFPESPWVFPAASKSGHIEEIRVEVPGVAWTPHDLRRTYLNVAERLEISAYALKALVNHRQPTGDVTSGYLRMEVERLRAPMQAITDRLKALCMPQAGKVVRLRR
ncbi:MAG: integrase family protein [Gammaproteobacteria bacterium]|nr:integrase family protein [Gammaproteobacteria bacterium]MBU1407285.1 integrase family protein [Gammaproteobacteria bacterium]MBU1531341.1 integrase family protein [Gammaproteobacteria bacterium]